jgi:acyl transferase domain-containing protein
MYCFHSAIRALEANDCVAAIVAGANLITSPEQHLGTAMAGVLSPASTCYTFDESANGYGRAEGVNAVYLKRLSSALRTGDKIWAVVRSSAVNSYAAFPLFTRKCLPLTYNVAEMGEQRVSHNRALPFKKQ